jgi:hypothetical protein
MLPRCPSVYPWGVFQRRGGEKGPPKGRPRCTADLRSSSSDSLSAPFRNSVRFCGELGQGFFQTLNNRWASRTIPTDRHVDSAHDRLSRHAKDEVDTAFNHRIYRMAACSSTTPWVVISCRGGAPTTACGPMISRTSWESGSRHNNHYNLDAISVFLIPLPPSPAVLESLRPVSFTTSSCAAINDEKHFVATRRSISYSETIPTSSAAKVTVVSSPR